MAVVDGKQRPLEVGQRITVPAIVRGIDGDRIAIETALNTDNRSWEIAPQTFSIPDGRHVLRCEAGDNNGLDDAVVADAAKRADDNYAGEMESRRATLAGLDAEIVKKTNANKARMAGMDAEFETAKAIHVARMAVVDKPSG